MATIERDEEHDCDALVFQTTVAGAPRETRLDFDYLSGPEWGELAALHARAGRDRPGPYRLGDGRRRGGGGRRLRARSRRSRRPPRRARPSSATRGWAR